MKIFWTVDILSYETSQLKTDSVFSLGKVQKSMIFIPTQKAIKKPVFQLILITQWNNTFSNICAFCWIYTWGQISSRKQYSVITSVKVEAVSKFPSYILFYCTQVSTNKIKENTESKVLHVTAENLAGNRKAT